MKKKYENHKIEVLVMKTEDILTSSSQPQSPSTGTGGLPIVP